MRERTVSNCEKAFLLQAIREGKRIDGRKENDYRKLKIIFGNSYGCCVVSLGETRVMAQTSYEVQTPKSTRLTEGFLLVNSDLSSMAAQHIEPGRPSEASIQLNRLLEKCLKESKCVDLESLCIVAEEKVWAIRVDVTILNHDGGLVDCASLAALASLAHSRRPDVTLSGEEVTIHSLADRDPLPLTLHHYPICVSYAIFDKGNKAVVDPTASEEDSAETSLVVGMNAFRELCGLHLDGVGLPTKEENDIVLQCVTRAGIRAVEVINILKQTLAEDEKKRQEKEKIGFSECVRLNKVSSLAEDRIPVRLNSKALQAAMNKLLKQKYKNKRKTWDEDGNEIQVDEDPDEEEIVDLGNNTAELLDQRSKAPKRIHVNLGQMDQENIRSTSEQSDTDASDEEPNEAEKADDNTESAETVDVEMSESDDVQEVTEHSDDTVEDRTAAKPSKKTKKVTNEIVKEKADANGSRELPGKGTSKKIVSEKTGTRPPRETKDSTKQGNNEEEEEVEAMSDDSVEIEVVREVTYEDKMRTAEKIVLDDSEEEETVVLPGNHEPDQPTKYPQEKEKPEDPKKKKAKKNKNKNKKARTWYPNKAQW